MMVLRTELVWGFQGTFPHDVQCWDLKFGPRLEWHGICDLLQFLYFVEHGATKSIPQDRAACIILPKIKCSPMCRD